MIRLTLLLLVFLAWCPTRGMAQSNDVQESLRLLPSNTVAFVQIPQPRRAVEQIISYFHQLELQRFDEVQELLKSTPSQRFSSFLQYLEKQYARSWPRLLDDVSGKGVALALVPVSGTKDLQLLASIEANNSEVLKQAYLAALDVIKQESEQNDQPIVAKQKPYRQILVTSLGNKFFVALHQNYVLASSNAGVMTAAIDQLLDKNQLTICQNSRFVVQERPVHDHVMAWGWVDLVHFKSTAKEQIEQFKLPTNDLIPQMILGGLFDTVIRSDHAWFAVKYEVKGPVLEVGTPYGRQVSQEGARIHMHDPARESILPLLNPTGTLFSSSFYWNLADLWNKRSTIFKEGALKDFEEGEKSIRPFLAGNTLSNFLNALGARHRFVITQQRNTGYAIKPKSPLPAFAVVLECNNPEQFSKMIGLPLRTAGLLFSTQVSMKLFEEEYHQSKVAGYRFNENAKNKYNEQGFLFNYSPSFARSGKYFIISSTRELCCDLIDELAKPATAGSDTVDVRHRFSWSALGQVLTKERPRLSTELTLRYGGSQDRVEEQINSLIKLLDKLGTIDLTVSHSPGFRFELRANYK